MAEEVIGIKITTDAAQATKDVQNLDKAFTDTDNSVKSLRTQLKEAQAQVGLMLTNSVRLQRKQLKRQNVRLI